ncbi:MAG: HAD-IIIC family phosphatase, partial [Rubripirellula sp.]|nr:HAD-IIIC family phosphatase [Rubripirellula sp.]
WDAVFAIKSLQHCGWTFALPAFTFTFCKTGQFHLHDTRSETGIFSDWLLEHLPDAYRTSHPIYSFAVIGQKAEMIADCPSSTTFGDDSPFGLFERENARLVMLGCGWDSCTQIHRYEELAKVPYRYFKDFKGTTESQQRCNHVIARMFVRDLELDPRVDTDRVMPQLRKNGRIASRSLFRGVVEAVDAVDLADESIRILNENPLHLLKNAEQVATAVAARRELQSQPSLRLVVLGRFNLQSLEKAWEQNLSEFLPERHVEFYSLPFGQLHGEILNPSSQLREFNADIRVFCDRWEDLTPSRDREALVVAVKEYAELIASLHETGRGWTIVHRFAVLTANRQSGAAREVAGIVAELNELLDEHLSHLEQVIWLDLAAEAASHPGVVLDPRLWSLGRFVFTEGFCRQVARGWVGFILAAVGKTSRLVVVDLDNTLWGGVLGEDGLEGIRIGGDYPGNAFADFQSEIKALTKRGIAVAIASKNDEDLALKAFNELPSMILRSEDVSTWRINWQAKYQNIKEMAEELNLGLGSVLFIDDNPIEREQVRLNLPAVKVLDLPNDPAHYPAALADSPFLAAASAATAEDLKRVQSFKNLKEFKSSATDAANFHEYLASLEFKVHFQRLNTGNSQRAAQLCQKTNQFNSTTKRYSLHDLQQLEQHGSDVIVIGMEDKMSSFENIGLVVLKPISESSGLIDLFLLSCRVLGRGLEKAVPCWVVKRAASRGWSTLSATIIETERNTPVRSVFTDAGYQSSGPGQWIANTDDVFEPPAWIELIDAMKTWVDVQ